VRFGIYSGIVVSIVYWFLFMIAAFPDVSTDPISNFMMWIFVSTFGILVPWLIIHLWKFFVRRCSEKITIPVVILLFLCCCFPPVFFYIIYCLLFCSTPWAVTSYVMMTSIIISHSKQRGLQFSLAQLMCIVSWFGGYFAAWRVAYLIVIQEYAKLPSTKPSEDCYICTAAARGHRRWVRSEEYRTSKGGVFRVNDQLRCFKAFELLLLTVSPKIHQLCRGIYDFIGPFMAAMIIYPFIADVAYTILKPLEWICQGVLFLITRDTKRCFRLLYQNLLDAKQ
jgi:hypothetical protein